MLNGTDSISPELALLLACCRVMLREEDKAEVRRILEQGIDWTAFALKAVDHGLAPLAGRSLECAAPDLVPDDILDAFHLNLEQTRRKNHRLFNELAGIIDGLEKQGIDAIPFKGPILAIEAYGDLGLRVFQDLDFLVRDSDMTAATSILHRQGFERDKVLTEAQIAAIQHIQGQEILFSKSAGIGVEPHTRLTPGKMALDIDYDGLWTRARRTVLNDRPMLTLAPEDSLLVLAIHGGKEMWWNIKWACDVAAFIETHPSLDWAAILERARVQGCLRMTLLATALARQYFDSPVPEAVASAERMDGAIQPMIARIISQWRTDEPGSPPSNKTVSMDRLRLHDGILRRARYVARTVLLPGPHHVAAIALPKRMTSAYVPIKLAHDLLALPMWRAYRQARIQGKRLQDALLVSDLALGLMPMSANAKLTLRQHQIARATAKRTLAAAPDNVAAWSDLGDAFLGLKRYSEAIASYDRALALSPDNIFLCRKRAAVYQTVGQKPDIVISPPDGRDADAWAAYATRLFSADRYAEAAAASDCALMLDSAHVAAARVGIQARLHSCNWQNRAADKKRISDGVSAGQHIITPYLHRAISDSEAESFVLSRNLARGQGFPPLVTQLARNHRRDGKIRIGYLSTETHDATTHMIAGVFEHHDRTRFETTAIALGPDERSGTRRRIKDAFDRFMTVYRISDDEAAAQLRALEFDIIVDLKGYTGDRRTGILARRPAPIQVSYLGYPCTMGVSFVDYIIADQVAIPEENRSYYSEQVAYLPHSYMATDNRRPVAMGTPNRSEAGLPETAFVFASFNYSYKISPEIFDVWMRLLRSVDGSVLWLRSPKPDAMSNLRREASKRGVASERIIFAPYAPRPEVYFGHLSLADIFLDTQPFNAHATAVDALWSGLPVVTCPGSTFAGRVAASLLHAIGLPELVTSSLTGYGDLAEALARDAQRLTAIRTKLIRNRGTFPLFDTARLTRDLEAAYTTMWERQQADLPPASFAIASDRELA